MYNASHPLDAQYFKCNRESLVKEHMCLITAFFI
jgi:hypothetical protein